VAERPECAETRDLLPELAAQTAAGDERARALGHLGDCPECRGELAATADLLDDMLALAPEHDPPPGFESRVLARMTAPDPAGVPPEPEPPVASGPVPARRRMPVPMLWAASIVVFALLAAGTVWWTARDERRLAAEYRHALDVAHGRSLRAAPLLTPAGTETGTLFVYEGTPSWLYVTFRITPPQGRYDVRLRTTDGRRLPLRPFTATATSAGWGSVIEVSATEVERLEFARAGVPLLTAGFG
jgi:hypothetical protein